MFQFNIPPEDMAITGFTKKDNSFLVNNQPRIFVGLKDNYGKFYKIGYALQYKNRKLSMYRCLKHIPYDINICKINVNYMETQDVDSYYLYKKNKLYVLK